jgi:pimeloyl-ACP methyl ester carboxylesterase
MLFGSFLSASVLATVLGGTAPTAATAKSALMASTASVAVHYHTVDIDGIKIFFCEAGDPSKPTILLLHGFPSSSHMYRELIPLLSPYFHVVAPDYPGLGYDRPFLRATKVKTALLPCGPQTRFVRFAAGTP